MNGIEAIQNAIPTDFSALDAQLAQASNYDANRYAKDDALFVQFYLRPLLDEEASKAAGRAIYKDTEFVKIMVPGDKTTMIDRPVRIIEDETARFPRQYAAFRAGSEEQIIGTPIGLLPGITPSQVEEYRYLGLRTVEQLANAKDDVVLKIMGLPEVRERAKKLLAVLEGKAEAEKEAARDDRIARLEAQNKALMEQLAALATAAPAEHKVPGTPLKKA